MQLRDTLLHSIDEAYEKRAWHGTNLRGSLRGLTLRDVWYRPAEGRHNIYELTAHAAYWKHIARRRLTGDRSRSTFALAGADWFSAPARPDETAWKALVRLLDAEHRLLRESIAGFADEDLSDRKTQRLVLGVAAHDVYHTGQIQLVKRLAQGPRP
ncbi:MAG: hypothetical protein QOH21_414 [Acidobacteriota bacterium]|jgi:uncharacterized damage-inducible protein DinB|nr:hypothetical protein [Acidobacteriota bacterium]